MRKLIEELQGRVERLEARLAVPADAPVDRTALDRAIRDLVRGNSRTLDRYLRRGGTIPKGEGETC